MKTMRKRYKWTQILHFQTNTDSCRQGLSQVWENAKWYPPPLPFTDIPVLSVRVWRREFSLTWPAAMIIFWSKSKCLQKKKGSTHCLRYQQRPTKPPFLWYGVRDVMWTTVYTRTYATPPDASLCVTGAFLTSCIFNFTRKNFNKNVNRF